MFVGKFKLLDIQGIYFLNMKSPFYSSVLLVIILTACSESKKDKAFRIFNEGVGFSVGSSQAQAIGKMEEAEALNKQSLMKFKETLAIDSSHPVARASLAHALYLDRQFSEAVRWFNKANRIDGESPANYREMGLSKINLGQVSDGKLDLDKAFSMDTSREIRDITVQDLTDIGELAFEYGNGYGKQGELAKGKEYKEFSVQVLVLAFHYDSSNRAIASKIAQFADNLGDKKTSAKYQLSK